MKKTSFVSVLAVLLLLPLSASAEGWKQFFRNRVPGVKVVNPLTGRPVVSADGHGVRRGGANASASALYGDSDSGTGGTGVRIRGTSSDDSSDAPSRGREAVIIRAGADNETPSFTGTLVSTNWFGMSGGPVELESKIQNELSKHGADFVLDSGTNDPCFVVGEPVICFVVGEPVAVSDEQGRDRWSTSRRRGSSSSSSSDVAGRYVVTVRAYLVRGNGGRLLLAEKSEFFTVEMSRRESWSWRNASRGRSVSSSGSRSATTKKDMVLSAARGSAARKAEGIIRNLLKDKSRKHWVPGASELVADAFRRQPASIHQAD